MIKLIYKLKQTYVCNTKDPYFCIVHFMSVTIVLDVVLGFVHCL